MEKIAANTIREGWEMAVHSIIKSNKKPDDVLKDEAGNSFYEVLNMCITVKRPLARKNALPAHCSDGASKFFTNCLIDPLKAAESGFVPGQRIHDFQGVDQLEQTVKGLEQNPNSRRASIITCDPTKDWADAGARPPSLLLIDFKLRNNKVHLTAIFRSNDIYRTWPLNAFSLGKLLQKTSRRLKIKPGTLTTHSISAHIYDDDYSRAEAISRAIAQR